MLTIKQCCSEFITDKIHKGIRKSTADRYRSIFRTYLVPRLGTCRIDRLTPNLVSNRLMPSLSNLNHRTIKKIITVLKTLYRFARITYRCPDTRFGLFKVERNYGLQTSSRHLIMTHRQLQRFNYTLAHHSISSQATFITLEQTGMRLGELLALTTSPSDFNLEQGYLHITKTKDTSNGLRPPKTVSSKRTLRLTSDIKTAVTRYLMHDRTEVLQKNYHFGIHDPSHMLIFPLSDSTIERRLRHLLVDAHLSRLLGHFTVHSFRRQFASYLIERHVPIASVSKYLGHANPQITLSLYANTKTTDDHRKIPNLGNIIAKI